MESIGDAAKYFVEIEDIKNNENVLLVMSYGSRVTDTAKSDSDLDLLIVINGNHGYRAARLVDGVHLDISIMTTDEVFDAIHFERSNGNMYVESVLTTGEVLYDPDNMHEVFLEELEDKIKRKRSINPVFASLTVDLLEKYLDSDNDDFYYFNALEFFRQLMHTKFNLSMFSTRKVYNVYTNRRKYKKNYKLKLPKLEFTTEYLNALVETDPLKRKRILLSYYETLKDDFNLVPFFSRANDLDLDDLKGQLVSLNNMVCYTEELLLAEHQYATPMYFIALYDLDNLIRNNMEVLPVDYEVMFNHAKSVTSSETRIRALEDLFMVIDSRIELDYDDFCIGR